MRRIASDFSPVRDPLQHAATRTSALAEVILSP